MRITRENLLTIARESAEKYARRNRGLACIYLTGSLMGDNPLLGGTTDIDLIFVHTSTPPFPREVIRLTDEVHLDIGHYSQTVFHQPRHLRVDPWVGAHLHSNAMALYDTAHWFEFTQASAGSQFDLPENVVARSRKLSDQARQSWLELQQGPVAVTPDRMLVYLSALANAANSITSLTDAPLTERRFILNYPERALAVGRPGLSSGLLDLFAPESFRSADMVNWFDPWKNCLQTVSLGENVPPRLAPSRLLYYERAAAALNEENTPAALWLVLRTWTRAVSQTGVDSVHLKTWEDSLQKIDLDSQGFENHLSILDGYLDGVEEAIDEWSQKYGV